MTVFFILKSSFTSLIQPLIFCFGWSLHNTDLPVLLFSSCLHCYIRSEFLIRGIDFGHILSPFIRFCFLAELLKPFTFNVTTSVLFNISFNCTLCFSFLCVSFLTCFRLLWTSAKIPYWHISSVHEAISLCRFFMDAPEIILHTFKLSRPIYYIILLVQVRNRKLTLFIFLFLPCTIT